MRRSTIGFLVAITGLCSGPGFGAGLDGVVFHLTGYEATRLYTSLRFEKGQYDWRTIVFMDRDRQFAERTPKAEGILDWSYVTSIRIIATKSSPSLKLMSIEFIDKDDQRHKKFELGLIDDAHLTELRQRYGRFLKFKMP